MSLGLNVSNLGVGGGSGPISVGATLQINGLTGSIAVIGDHASLTLTMSDASTILSQTWGSTPGRSASPGRATARTSTRSRSFRPRAPRRSLPRVRRPPRRSE